MSEPTVKKYRVTLPRDIIEHIRGFSEPAQWWPTEFVINQYYTQTCERFLLDKGCRYSGTPGGPSGLLQNKKLSRRIYMGSQAECEKFTRYVIETLYAMKKSTSSDLRSWNWQIRQRIFRGFVKWQPNTNVDRQPGRDTLKLSTYTPAMVIDHKGETFRLMPIDRSEFPFAFDTVESFHQQLGVLHLEKRERRISKNGKMLGVYDPI